jgi:hypothetical protein
MRSNAAAFGAVLAVTVLGCGKDAFTPTSTDVAGSYAATTFTTTANGTTTDHLAAGASFALTLDPNGGTTGRLFIPGAAEGGGDLDADMVGTWTLSGSTVTFTQAADTFVRDMAFSVEQNRLRGDATFGDTRIRVVLDK